MLTVTRSRDRATHPNGSGHRWPRRALAVAAPALAALVTAWWTPRGPATEVQALVTMAVGLGVGLVAGAALRSRWAMVLAPAVFVLVFELARVGASGPTVDAIDLGSFYGVGAFVVGRLVHGLLVLIPMVVGAAYGRAWAVRRQRGLPEVARGWRRAGRAARRTGVAVLSGALVLLAAGIARPPATDQILAADGAPLPGSVAEVTRVELGGHDQTLLVRGNSTDNPVLLFLAGGPGGPEIGTMSRYGGALERDFVVVTWDQRGAGASYDALEPSATFTFDQAVKDTIELTQRLRQRFGVERVYLVGNSYGTLLGVRAVEERPDLYAAFVGTGQMVSVAETDRAFYADTLAWAEQNGDRALADQLLGQGEPPYADLVSYAPLFAGEQQWNDYSARVGGRSDRDPAENLMADEYTLMDRVGAAAGLIDSMALLYPQLQDLDLRVDAPRVDVPVYLVEGRYEARGRIELVRDWYAALQAPSKQLITFERSGHRPFVEEPQRMAQVMRGVLADTGVTATPVAAAAATEPADDLLGLFTRYNGATWPWHLVAYGIALLVVGLVLLRPGKVTDRVTAGALAAMWLWLGVGFHATFAAQVDPLLGAAYAALFVVQAFLLARAGIVRRELAFTAGRGVSAWVGWGALAYALVVYPVIGAVLGHGWPQAPLVGMAPCPSAIATFGLLLLAMPPLPRHLLAIPLMWAVLAPLAAVGRGVPEDLGLLVFGVLSVAIVLVRDRRPHAPEGEATAEDTGAVARLLGRTPVSSTTARSHD